MNVYLLRHGKAQQQAASDSERALTSQGRQDILVVAGLFALKHIPVELCIVSPYLRAQQSAEIFLHESGSDISPETSAILAPESRPQAVLDFLQTLDAEEILLVGHNPLLSALFALLTQGDSRYPEKILAAGELCCISFDVLGAGLGDNTFSLSAPDEA